METIPHYYGDIVRRIFLVCALIMLFTLPFVHENLTSPIFYSILAILILTFFAGLTNPKQKMVIMSDIVVSILSFGVFAYQTVVKFDGFFNLFFITNFVLALLSLLAFYWSIKTIRWLKSPQKIPIEHIAPKISPVKDGGAPDNVPVAKKAELSEEERRKKRFLAEE